jgi:hypothetical protein
MLCDLAWCDLCDLQMESENRELRAALGTVSKQSQAQTSLVSVREGLVCPLL